MGLSLPPAVSISSFKGGYRSVTDYNDLADSETSDAQNAVYGPNADIDKRQGALRLYNRRLTTTSATTTGEPITGHYFFDKLGSTSTYHVVCAGDVIYNYTSSTANPIRTTLTDNSNTFFSFTQVQDPRSAADDIALMTNGVDPIQIWNGTATAVALSSFTSATQVPVCRYLINHKERVYAANIVDATDADAAARVYRTGFGSDGAADPHRFTESFYVGGSSKDGPIQNVGVLNDQIVFYKRSAVWKFNPGSGDVNDLQQMQDQIGLLAPFSLVNAGNFHIFLSEQGVQAFDGNSFVHLSKDVDDILLSESNRSQLQYAKGVYDKRLSQYRLYFPLDGSDRNNVGFIYDLRIKAWQPPVTGRRVSFLSTFDDSNGLSRVLWGDYLGYLFEDNRGNNDGLQSGYNGTATAAAATTLTDGTAAFSTTGDGLAGMIVRIIGGTGNGQERLITSNTGTILTVETQWTQIPDTTSLYTVAGIDAYWRSKDYAFGAEDLVKLFRHVRVRTKEEGNITLILNYIVDFAQLNQSTSANISMLEDGFAWDVGRWNQVRWGGRSTIRKKISLRSTASQSTSGTHLALRFSNRRANETFKLQGFDVELKPTSKR